MDLETAREVLLWCTLVNYGVLLVWFLVFRSAHDWMYGLHSRWFRIAPERFDALHYGAMALYKVGILLFNLVPFLALLITS